LGIRKIRVWLFPFSKLDSKWMIDSAQSAIAGVEVYRCVSESKIVVMAGA
jgi:hypothetical protein